LDFFLPSPSLSTTSDRHCTDLLVGACAPRRRRMACGWVWVCGVVVDGAVSVWLGAGRDGCRCCCRDWGAAGNMVSRGCDCFVLEMSRSRDSPKIWAASGGLGVLGHVSCPTSHAVAHRRCRGVRTPAFLSLFPDQQGTCMTKPSWQRGRQLSTSSSR
jgi:hypothetical protein